MIDFAKFIKDPSLYTKIDEVNSSIVYLGQSRQKNPDDTDAVFDIIRISKKGLITTVENANGGDMDKKWSDRTTIFPSIMIDNQFSTSFDGINDFLSGGDVHTYDASNAFSVSMWVKPDNIASNMILFAKAGAGPDVNGYMLRSNASTGAIYLQLRSATDRTHTFNSTLTAGAWQLLTFTYAGGSNINGAMVYLGSTKDSSTPASGSVSTWLENQAFTIGSRTNTMFFSGNIDEVTVWNKELSQSDVTELYNSGAPVDPTAHTASTNLKSYYKMGDGDVYPTISDKQGTDDLTMTNMTDDDFLEDVP